MAGYYAIIPATVRYDKELKPNAKLLYGEITALCNARGFCWASNEYFAELYEVDKATVSRWISSLVDKGYISVNILKMQGNKRKMTIDNNINTYRQKSQDLLTKKSIPIDKKVISNNRSNNTINNTDNNEIIYALDFFSENYPVQYESFLMKYKKRINDFPMFVSNFNAVCEREEMNFSDRAISGRLTIYANNWIQNTNKNKSRNMINEGVVARPEFKKIS